MNRRDFLSRLSVLSSGCVFYQCGLAAGAERVSACSDTRPLTIRGNRILVVDVHGHTLFPQINQIMRSGSPGGRGGGGPRPAGGNGPGGFSMPAGMTDIDQRLKDMESLGIDIQIISPSPGQFFYNADRETSQRSVQIQNEGMAGLAASHPDRFAAMGTLSMQYPELAIAQLEGGVKELGLKGFMIGGLIGEYELSHASFEKFWAKAEELNTVIFIHPLGSGDGSNIRLKPFNMNFAVGTPIDETLAISHLIFGGVLDRYPGLKVCVAHGGGYLPYFIGRSDNCYETRPPCQTIDRPPSEYLRDLYYDSRVFRPDTLRLLVDVAGADKIMLGTDYPFPVQDTNPAALICSTPGLSAEETEAILGKNAIDLFAL